MAGWNTTFLLGMPIFRGELLVSGRVCAKKKVPRCLSRFLCDKDFSTQEGGPGEKFFGTIFFESYSPETSILLMEEILHRFIGSLSHYLKGFIHPRRLYGISSISIRILLKKGWLEDDPFLLKWSLFRQHSFIFSGVHFVQPQKKTHTTQNLPHPPPKKKHMLKKNATLRPFQGLM